jgi:hypothetical protein
VSLTNNTKDFGVSYWLESPTSTKVHFSLSFPKGFAHDTLVWDFGDGTTKTIRADTSLVYNYAARADYAVIIRSPLGEPFPIMQSLQIRLSANAFSFVVISYSNDPDSFRFEISMPGYLSNITKCALDFGDGARLMLSSSFMSVEHKYGSRERFVAHLLDLSRADSISNPLGKKEIDLTVSGAPTLQMLKACKKVGVYFTAAYKDQGDRILNIRFEQDLSSHLWNDTTFHLKFDSSWSDPFGPGDKYSYTASREVKLVVGPNCRWVSGYGSSYSSSQSQSQSTGFSSHSLMASLQNIFFHSEDADRYIFRCRGTSGRTRMLGYDDTSWGPFRNNNAEQINWEHIFQPVGEIVFYKH